MDRDELETKIKESMKLGTANWFDVKDLEIETYSIFINDMEVFFTDYSIYEELPEDALYSYNKEDNNIEAEIPESSMESVDEIVEFTIGGGMNFSVRTRLIDIKNVYLERFKVETK